MALTIRVAEIIETSTDPLLGKRPSWGRALLRDIAAIWNGFPFKSSKFTRGKGMPLIRIRDIGAGRTEINYAGEYDPAHVVETGDLLVGMDGAFKCARWRGPKGLLNQRVCRLIPRTGIYHPKLLEYLLPAYLEAIHRMTSSVTVKHLSSKSLAEIPLPLPPWAEQERIVAEIEKQYARLDAGVVALMRAKGNLRRYRAAILKAAFNGRLAETEAERARREGRSYESGALLLRRILATRFGGMGTRRKGFAPSAAVSLPAPPEGWIWATYAQVGNVTTGFTPPTRDAENFAGDIPFFRPADLVADADPAAVRGHLSDKWLKNKRLIPAGSMLVTCIGLTIGDAILAPFDCAINQQINAVTLNQDLVDAAYVHLWTVSPAGRRQILAEASATIVPILNKYRFGALPLPLPPLAEQRRIVAKINRHLGVVETLRHRIDAHLKHAERLRRSVLKKVLLDGRES